MANSSGIENMDDGLEANGPKMRYFVYRQDDHFCAFCPEFNITSRAGTKEEAEYQLVLMASKYAKEVFAPNVPTKVFYCDPASFWKSAWNLLFRALAGKVLSSGTIAFVELKPKRTNNPGV